MQISLNIEPTINNILIDYKYSDDIFNEDDVRVRLLKYIINNNLNDVEKRLIILYIDTQSFRKVAKELNISVSTCYNYINRIKRKIILLYDTKVAK